MNLSKKTLITLLILIILLQVIFRIYIGTKKEYFHMDEAYSYGLMNYDKLSIVDNSDFLNTWHNKEYYLDYFEVNSKEAKNIGAVFENQKNDVHPPLYYLLLRISASFTIDNFTKWTGLALNMIIFAVSSVFVYLLSKKIFKKDIYALLVTLVNGFTLISLDSAMYIRMYELANLMVLITCYLHINLLDKPNLSFKNLLPLGIILILGGLTHYYFFVFAIGLYLIFSARWIKNKEYKNWIKYTVAIIISAVIYLLIWPYAINHILFGYRGVGANEGKLEAFTNNLNTYLFSILNRGIFNYLIVLVILAVWLCCIKREKRNVTEKTNISLLLGLPIIIYLLLVALNSPYIEIRYIIPIYSITTITYAYLVKQIIEKYWDDKHTLYITSAILLIVLVSPLVTKTKLEMTYTKYNNIAQKVKESNMPIIYVFNTDNNRFLDDVYLFTLAEKSIVLDNKIEYINTLKDEKENFILICNEGTDGDKIKENLSDKDIEYVQRMNACDIYFIYNK